MTVHRHNFDEITVLLGHIPEEEHTQRQRIRDCRAMASRMIHGSGPNGRALLWMAIEVATEYYLSGHDVGTLERVALFCRDLIKLADQASHLEASDGLA